MQLPLQKGLLTTASEGRGLHEGLYTIPFGRGFHSVGMEPSSKTLDACLNLQT